MIGNEDVYPFLIEKAKEKSESNYSDDRDWKSVRITVPGWAHGGHDIELISRPGSPCKGYIIVNYGTGIVRAFSVSDRIIGLWRAFHYRISMSGELVNVMGKNSKLWG